MKLRLSLFALLVIFTGLVLAQTAPPSAAPSPSNISSVLDHSISGAERLLVGVAEAMPEEKYSFAPTNGEYKGVRTFAEQVKHVASTNYTVFSAILGEPGPKAGEQENGPASLKTKAQIVKYLQDSFALGHRAMASINEQNAVTPIKSPFGSGSATRLGMAATIISHCGDHYGQLIEYLRMNGIVPPASRR